MGKHDPIPADFRNRATKPEVNGRAPEVVGLEGRVLLGELLRGGIEPTPQLVEELLYEGRMHSVAGEPGSGKTLLALWLATQVMRGGGRVLYFDAENGPRLVAERLRDLGVDEDALDANSFYYPADITLDPEDLSRLSATVAEVRPALAVFDSFADFIAAAGLEENSNTDLTKWVSKVCQPLKDAGIAVLILDHIPKNSSKGPRGAGAKVAKVDVQWNLETSLEYDRERTGEITLKLSKDRECWLPKIVRFSVGGGVFVRSAGTLEDRDGDGLTHKQHLALEYLEGRGAEGASWSALLDELGGSKGTLSTTLKRLHQLNLIEKRNNRYHVRPPTEPKNTTNKPDKEGSVRFNGGSVKQTEPGTPGEVQSGSPLPLGRRPIEPGAPNLDERTVGEELRRAGSGPARALAHYLTGPNPERLKYLTRAVLVARGMDAAGGVWERHAPVVKAAADDPQNHPLDCECVQCL